jgi:hypothetical protein
VTKNVAASVHRRLLNRARSEGRPFAELLQYFTLERFLYRLGRSSHAADFVLKGALMFGAWEGPFFRPTRDIDLLGKIDNQVELVVEAMQAICREPVPEDDGLRFDPDSAVGEAITLGAQYPGVRVRLDAWLGEARVRLQVDVGFGDILVPGPVTARLPTMLDFPPPEVQGYTRESTVAEKFQAMVYLGQINSRMKDFYDIWSLASRFPFDGRVLALAVREAFRARRTTLQVAPVVFTPTFSGDSEKQAQWRAFVGRHPFEQELPTLDAVTQVIAALLRPVVLALVEERSFDQHWLPGHGWQPGVPAPD